MLTHLEFRSDRFPAGQDEEDQINPGHWGKRLAAFLSERLRARGFRTSDPIAEDWGYSIEVANDGFRLSIGCGNYPEYPDGFLCFIEPHTPFVRTFLKKLDTRESIAALQAALDSILTESAGVQEKRWWTYEEFNNPGRQRFS